MGYDLQYESNRSRLNQLPYPSCHSGAGTTVTCACTTETGYLKDLKTRFGGIDQVLLWAGYPNLGATQ